jgi:hypothetical protein
VPDGVDHVGPSERDAIAQELLAAAGVGDEADVLAVGLGGGAQAGGLGAATHLGLREVPDGEQGAGQLALGSMWTT